MDNLNPDKFVYVCHSQNNLHIILGKNFMYI